LGITALDPLAGFRPKGPTSKGREGRHRITAGAIGHGEERGKRIGEGMEGQGKRTSETQSPPVSNLRLQHSHHCPNLVPDVVNATSVGSAFKNRLDKLDKFWSTVHKAKISQAKEVLVF